jgi:hypothetical protein
MTEKLVFSDLELDLFQPKLPITFSNGGKDMAVSDSLVNESGYVACPVLAYLPDREYPVITPQGQYKYCAEIPIGEIRVNKFLDHNSMLIRGKVSTIVALAGTGKTESLCQNAVDACHNDYNVLYISLELSMDAIFNRIQRTTLNPLRNLQIVKGIHRMNTRDVCGIVKCARFQPDVVVLDYFNLVEPFATSTDPDARRRIAYFELVDIARKNDIAIVTAEAVSPV